jgi:hypothetical protein
MIAGQLEIELFANVARIKADMERAVGVVTTGAGQMQRAAEMVRTSFGGLFAGMSVGAIAAWVKNAADAADVLNDVSDATGAAVEGLSALQDIAKRNGHSFDTVTQAMLKFNQTLQQTTKPGSDAEAVLKALGLRTSELRAMDPAEAFHKTARAMAEFAQDGNLARATSELFGKSLREVAPLLKDLADRGVLNATVTREQAEQAARFNKELANLKANAELVGRAMAHDIVRGINEAAKAMRESGLIEAMRVFLTGSDRHKADVGMVQTMERILALQNTIDKANEAKDLQRVERLKVQLQQARAEYEMYRGHAKVLDGPAAAASGPSLNVETPEQKAAREAAAKEAARRLEQQRKMLLEFHGMSASFYEEWENWSAMFARGAISMDTLTAAQAELIAQQPFFKKNQQEITGSIAQTLERWKEEAAVMLQAANAYADVIEQRESGVAKLREELEAERVSAAAIGATAAQLAHLEQAKLLDRAASLERRATLADDIDFSGRMGDAYREEAKLLRDLAAAKSATVQQREAHEATQKQQQEWMDLWRDIDDTARRTFTDVAENGVGAFERIGKTLKSAVLDVLWQMTGRRWLLSIGASMGVPGAAMAQQALGAGPLGQFGGVGTFGGMLGAFGNGASAGFSMLTNGGALESISGALSMMGSATGASSFLAGAGQLAGTIAPPVAAALAIYSLVKGSQKPGGPKLGGRFGEGLDSGIGLFGNSLVGQVQPVVEAMQAQYDAIVRAFGGSAGARFGLAISTDPQGTAPNFLEAAATRNGQQLFSNLDLNVGRSQEALQAALDRASKEAVLRALQSADLAGELGAYVRNLGDLSALSVDAITKAIERLQKAATERQALEEEIWLLTHTEAEAAARSRQMELDAVDASNRALMVRVHQLRDEKAAAEAAARAAEEAARVQARAAEEAARVQARAAEEAARALDRARDSARSYTEFLDGIGAGVRGWIDRMNATPAGMLPPETQLANARLQFQQQMALAQAGNRGALSGITGYADQLLAAQTALTASGAPTAQTMADIRAALASLPGFQSAEEYLASVIQATSDEQVDAFWGATGTFTAAFEAMDADLDGLLTFAELQSALGPLASDQTLLQLISRVDANGDGQISKLEAVVNNISALRSSIVGYAPDLVLGPGEHFFFAGGGVMTAGGPIPLRTYSGGGIANSPQMAIFGEGSVPEAYVPVPNGQIPVEIRGGGNAGLVEELREVREELRQHGAMLAKVFAAGTRAQVGVLHQVADNTGSAARAARLDAAKATV